MKIKRFCDILTESKNDSLEERLKDYYLDLIDETGYSTKYVIVPHTKRPAHPWNSLPQRQANSFILRGSGNEEELETFIERVESMEPVRVCHFVNNGLNVVLCISNEYYSEIDRCFDLYFKYVHMEMNDNRPYFFYNNTKNRIDPHDGIEIRSGSEYVAYETQHHNQNVFFCNNSFWTTFVNKLFTADYEFIASIIKLSIFDRFGVNISRPQPKYLALKDAFINDTWQKKPKVHPSKRRSLEERPKPSKRK